MYVLSLHESLASIYIFAEKLGYSSAIAVGRMAEKAEPRIKQRGCATGRGRHMQYGPHFSQTSLGNSVSESSKRSLVSLILQIRKLKNSWEIPLTHRDTQGKTQLIRQSCFHFLDFYLFIFLTKKKMYPFCLSELLTPSQTKCYETLTEGLPVTRVS